MTLDCHSTSTSGADGTDCQGSGSTCDFGESIANDDCSGGVYGGSGNLDGTGTCGFTFGAALLGTLVNETTNDTYWHPITSTTSDAYQASSSCPSLDQGNTTRKSPSCDLGAYELVP